MTERIVYMSQETLIESILKDFVTFGFLILCIWFSSTQESAIWTFISMGMFGLFILGKCETAFRHNRRVLRGKKAAIEWATNLPGDE